MDITKVNINEEIAKTIIEAQNKATVWKILHTPVQQVGFKIIVDADHLTPEQQRIIDRGIRRIADDLNS